MQSRKKKSSAEYSLQATTPTISGRRDRLRIRFIAFSSSIMATRGERQERNIHDQKKGYAKDNLSLERHQVSQANHLLMPV